MFKKLRILFLLYVLLLVAITTWSTRERNTDWFEPLWVVIYPINGADSAIVDRYIKALSEANFAPIETLFRNQGSAYGLAIKNPVDVRLAPQVLSSPPVPPASGNPLAVAYWSLHLRYWAWRNDSFDGPSDIRLFAVYYDPDEHPNLAHSLGLRKGFLGVVNGYGNNKYDGRNNVVWAHEMLHTLGASDKYHPTTNQALFPIGYADPEQTPLYPQTHAELMAGRIPLSENKSKMPDTIRKTLIGNWTALEIGWLR